MIVTLLRCHISRIRKGSPENCNKAKTADLRTRFTGETNIRGRPPSATSGQRDIPIKIDSRASQSHPFLLPGLKHEDSPQFVCSVPSPTKVFHPCFANRPRIEYALLS